MQRIFETPFDIVYLIFVIAIGMIMMVKAGKNRYFRLYGLMAVILGAGDSFHLIPRVLALNTTGFAAWTVPLGIGKLITSITMTLFYCILFELWAMKNPGPNDRNLRIWIYVLAVIRIVLCLLPQNDWTGTNPPLSWAIFRNIPFAIIGILMIVLFWKSDGQDKNSPYRWMWLAILLSFAFYIPVVLFADTWPFVGMLMIPKTCAYVWIVCMGWSAQRKWIRDNQTKTRRV